MRFYMDTKSKKEPIHHLQGRVEDADAWWRNRKNLPRWFDGVGCTAWGKTMKSVTSRTFVGFWCDPGTVVSHRSEEKLGEEGGMRIHSLDFTFIGCRRKLSEWESWHSESIPFPAKKKFESLFLASFFFYIFCLQNFPNSFSNLSQRYLILRLTHSSIAFWTASLPLWTMPLRPSFATKLSHPWNKIGHRHTWFLQ